MVRSPHLRFSTLGCAFIAVACGGPTNVENAGEVSRDARRTPPLEEACAASDECFRVGLALEDRGRVEAARAAFRKSCKGEPAHREGCARFVHLSAKEHLDMSATKSPEFERAEEVSSAAHVACFEWHGAPSGANELRAEACMVLADALKKNERLLNRSGADWTPYLTFSNACAFGNDAGCAAMKAETVRPPRESTAADESPERPANPPAKMTPSDVEGANLRMTGMNVDGVALDDIACKLREPSLGTFLAGIAVGAGFKSKKTALDACSKGAVVRTRVRWTGASGRMTSVKASGDDANTNRCVERALAGAISTVDGTCAASVTHGRT